MKKLLEVLCVVVLGLGASASADAFRPDSDLVSNSGKGKSGPLVFNGHPLDAHRETDAFRPDSTPLSNLGKGKADSSVFNSHPLDAHRETITYCVGSEGCNSGPSPQGDTFLGPTADDFSPAVDGLGSGDEPVPVPEPASLVLLGSGLLTTASIRRRKLLR
jgi:hypothetical protein